MARRAAVHQLRRQSGRSRRVAPATAGEPMAPGRNGRCAPASAAANRAAAAALAVAAAGVAPASATNRPPVAGSCRDSALAAGPCPGSALVAGSCPGSVLAAGPCSYPAPAADPYCGLDLAADLCCGPAPAADPGPFAPGRAAASRVPCAIESAALNLNLSRIPSHSAPWPSRPALNSAASHLQKWGRAGCAVAPPARHGRSSGPPAQLRPGLFPQPPWPPRGPP
jgi:hypothetical protein